MDGRGGTGRQRRFRIVERGVDDLCRRVAAWANGRACVTNFCRKTKAAVGLRALVHLEHCRGLPRLSRLLWPQNHVVFRVLIHLEAELLIEGVRVTSVECPFAQMLQFWMGQNAGHEPFA